MSPYILTTLLLTLGLGTTITFASTHWLLAWMGLELNTLAILPLMAQHHHPRAVEATTKYFLVQATAAATILFAGISNAWFTGQWEIQQMSHPLPCTLLILALALKIGLAPLHTWLPEVLQGLNLNTGLILSTWQKLAPFSIIVQLNTPYSPTLIILGITSTLIGGWGGINQTQLRKILAYSSIAHLGWMILVLQFSPTLTLLALFTYIAMTSSLFLLFNFIKATNINTLATTWSKAPVLTAFTPLVLFSLGGLPPLTGFLPKWMILQELTKQDLAPIATIAALSALLSLYFYLRLSYAMTLTTSPNTTPSTLSWRLPSHSLILPMSLMTTMSICLLPISPATISLLTP
uniref:NADH-ubiquinone oxidoreductase chain 2 n=1 Tax=Pachypanchax playfairii TaxID=52664 RepID=A0A517FL54_9TELE|nr:NADH dehydrogenase subunit 2 [Pachypanchax playfairii]QDS02597.1 NADH dehydrogenase subunit 2 [Pachypanchax playfairii]